MNCFYTPKCGNILVGYAIKGESEASSLPTELCSKYNFLIVVTCDAARRSPCFTCTATWAPFGCRDSFFLFVCVRGGLCLLKKI